MRGSVHGGCDRGNAGFLIVLLMLVLNATVPALALPLADSSEPPQTVSLQALHQQVVEGQFVCALGDVRIAYQDIRVQCDVLEYDQQTMQLKASGNVVLDQANTRVACDRLEFDLTTKTGTFFQVDAFLPPTYHFRGAELQKLDATHYRFRKGLFTSCSLTDDAPPWSIEISDAMVEMEGYGRFRGVSLRVRGVPVFYTPRLLWPVKRDRAAGLLVPNIGYNNRRGAYLGNALYWPISRSVDTTLYLDLYSKGWAGIGDEVRWAPTESARGQIQLYTLRDPDGRSEWKAFGKHAQLFAGGYALKAALQEFSDIDFFQQFERTANDRNYRDTYSHLTLTRSWGTQTLNFRTDHRRTFGLSSAGALAQTTATADRLPEAEYRLRSTRVGSTPLYVSLVALADQLRIEKSATLRGRYGRFDLFPTVSLLSPGFPWLNITPTVGARETYYTSQFSEDRKTLVNESLSRSYWTGGLSLVGPSVSRIWKLDSDRKLKHLVEPRVEYSYVSNPGDISRIPVFDERDSLLVTNRMRWTLANRLFYKQGETGSREVASLELSQEYSFSDLFPAASGLEPSRRGPFSAWLRTTPWVGGTIDARVDFEPVTKSLQGSAVTGSFSRGASNLGLTWFASYDPVGKRAVSSQSRVSGALAPASGRWRIEAYATYDIHNRNLIEQLYKFRWRGSCWSAYAEIRDYRGSLYKTRDYRISIDLTGLGTFLDIRGGLDTGD